MDAFAQPDLIRVGGAVGGSILLLPLIDGTDGHPVRRDRLFPLITVPLFIDDLLLPVGVDAVLEDLPTQDVDVLFAALPLYGLLAGIPLRPAAVPAVVGGFQRLQIYLVHIQFFFQAVLNGVNQLVAADIIFDNQLDVIGLHLSAAGFRSKSGIYKLYSDQDGVFFCYGKQLSLFHDAPSLTSGRTAFG